VTSVVLDRVVLMLGAFRLEADAVFGPGLHVVVGRIGAGKSTLALALGGGLAPSSGEMRMEGISRRLWLGSSPGHHLTGATVEAEVASWGLDPVLILEHADLAGVGLR
jgi:energy-coupling factor transport system ATP-binding protein